MKKHDRIARLIFLPIITVPTLIPIKTRQQLQTTQTRKIQGSNLIGDPKEALIVTTAQINNLELEDLMPEQARQLKALIAEFADIFAENHFELGRSGVCRHQITTTTQQPIYRPPYRTPKYLEDFIKEELTKMLEAGIIQESSSPWAFPVVIVNKKDGTLRFCVDYRALNDITIKDRYPLPRIDEMLESLGSAKWFTALDLASGYWQIEMEPDSIAKTAFTTKFGNYEWRVMPFGLTNAPATFQRTMNEIFRDRLWKTVMVYLDDLNVFSDTFDHHLSHLREVFTRIRRAGLRLKMKKCSFAKRQIAFLGHVVNDQGIQPDPAKIKSVQDWPRPQNTTEVRQFLGLASYYRKFVKGFAAIADPLYHLLRRKTSHQWTQSQQTAFDQLKQALITAPVLAYPNLNNRFSLHTDASGTGIGAVLTQEDNEGKEHPVAYISRSLSRAERNYSTTEKEALAIIWATKYFHQYLYGTEFDIITDHQPLQWYFKQKNPIGRVARWIVTLMDYSPRIMYRPGRTHQNADSLSRINHYHQTTDPSRE